VVSRVYREIPVSVVHLDGLERLVLHTLDGQELLVSQELLDGLVQLVKLGKVDSAVQLVLQV
jgi:hypothetical protein